MNMETLGGPSQSDLLQLSLQLTTLEEIADTLESLHSFSVLLGDLEQNDYVSATELEGVNNVGDELFVKSGGDEPFPNLENYYTVKEYLQITQEEVSAKAKELWEKLVESFKKVLEYVKNFLVKLFNGFEQMDKTLDSMIKRDIKELKNDGKIKVKSSVAKTISDESGSVSKSHIDKVIASNVGVAKNSINQIGGHIKEVTNAAQQNKEAGQPSNVTTVKGFDWEVFYDDVYKIRKLEKKDVSETELSVEVIWVNSTIRNLKKVTEGLISSKNSISGTIDRVVSFSTNLKQESANNLVKYAKEQISTLNKVCYHVFNDNRVVYGLIKQVI